MIKFHLRYEIDHKELHNKVEIVHFLTTPSKNNVMLK